MTPVQVLLLLVLAMLWHGVATGNRPLMACAVIGAGCLAVVVA